MPRTLPTPDRLFDRTWRPGHPFRPRVSATRRWIMGAVFCVLCVVIGGYWFITDSDRVRQMAETYLSQLLGGRVRVGDARLSIFEGLRLDSVRLYSDDTNSADSLLFSAHSFLIHYDPRALLTGKIEATRIVAVEPRVHVTEDADTGKRNYSRMLERRPAEPSVGGGVAGRIVLPEIVLRNAQVEYKRHRNGRVIESTSLAIEGRLMPVPASEIYSFTFQSRGKFAGIGPMVTGRMVMGSGQITASLQNFEFGPDVKSLLPPEVRDWWEQHQLSGRLNIPVLSLDPPTSSNGRLRYHIEIELQGVKLSVRPQQWLSSDEDRQLNGVYRAFNSLRNAGLNDRAFVDRVAELVEPTPISLKDVRGKFTFSDDETIKIEDLNGRLEEIPLKVSGVIKGYTPAAEARIRVASSELSDIEIPPAPRYLNSLPPGVREIYDRFKPRGTCRFWVELLRPAPGARPIVNGEISIIDGNFTFEKFPYPLRKATGQIVISQNPQTGEESLRIDRIRGYGAAGGPNADSVVEVDGIIAPFGPDARVDIKVRGKNVSSEPQLIAAFPTLTRKALTLFDAPGKGEFPKFSGDFECSIIRLRGIESHWIIETTIDLAQATGALVAFPYPMSGVSGRLIIRDDHLEMSKITMNRNGASLQIDGRVSWPSGESERLERLEAGPLLKPDLKVVARNVPIDKDLLAALPPGRRAWLEKIGAGGRFDLDGVIKPAQRAEDDLEIDFTISLRDATLWPHDGVFAVSEIGGTLRLTNQRLTLDELRGKRGEAIVSARGEINWPDEKPTVVLEADAKNLVLDQPLYQLLPEPAQAAWQQVRPEGTVDVSMNYSGGVRDESEGATSSSLAGGYEIVITPRKLSATPLAVPYRLDELAGTLTFTPGRAILKDLTARHGDAKLALAGSGSIAERQVWDFTLSGEGVPVDDEFRKALPQSLAELLTSLRMSGRISFEFSRLHIESTPGAAADATTQPASPGDEIDADFVVKLRTDAASMDVGVPLADVRGVTELAGSSRAGKLSALTGRVKVDSLSLAGRTVSDFRADLHKSADAERLTIANMQAKLAGGSMAGQVDYGFPDNAPSSYRINLILRNADVKELAGESEQDIQGQLSASLALEGVYNHPGSRRGRGDVSVSGKEMYKIPLVLGLLQITNLSLPITSPFTEASTTYSLEGQRVTFEQIELRSKGMLMQGSGNLDFASKQVRLKFFTDNANWPKLPVIGELLQGARQELLQIHVRGTLQEPKVSARSMNTLTTTVDEVFKGDERRPTTSGK